MMSTEVRRIANLPPNVGDARRAANVSLQALYVFRVRSIPLLGGYLNVVDTARWRWDGKIVSS